MFAALIRETDPLLLQDLPVGLLTWLQVVGGFALAGATLWLAIGLPKMHPRDRAAIPRSRANLFALLLLLAVVGYVVGGVGFALAQNAPEGSWQARVGQSMIRYGFAGGGLCAILAAGMPFFLNVVCMRFRRIFALAKLSFKEAIRRRVLYAFGLFLLLILFVSWFAPAKPEDQVRTYVTVMFWSMSILLLFVAVLMSAFSIPNDIKQQTIHTIVTKPVERFEVVLGRFLGFLALMTIVLVIMTTISLFMVRSGVTPEAAAESLKAREPLRGDLRFENTGNEKLGTNVGREWDYRSYITRPDANQPPQTARWEFVTVPANLGARERVLCEYTFDIYRTTKGKEGADVSCSFKFYTWRYRPDNDKLYRKEHGAVRDAQKEDALAEKYGYYEINSLPVTDFHTQSFYLPGGLFRNASGSDPERDTEIREMSQRRPPALVMRVTCDSATQYVGMARDDLYVRLDDPNKSSEKWLFSVNFFKAAFGLWLRLALIIGLAVIFSTYLSGVISLLVALLMYLGGISKDFIQEVAKGLNPGGGPLEAMVRMSRRELTGASMSESLATTEQIVSASDQVYRVVLRPVLYMIPDVDRFDMTSFVAEGFNIPADQMFLSALLLLGYLLPWAVLAYYLMKWREVANPN
jgi:ABC-type transport system involved in multi-copper enzyme maturation permease subunit